jgi:N-acylglucosamine 2-epimerase
VENERMSFLELQRFYHEHLINLVLPFWLRYGVDREAGGLFNFLADDGSVVSTDKAVWSQGRALWTFSALYRYIKPESEYLTIARGILDLLVKGAHMQTGAVVPGASMTGDSGEGER